MQICCPDCGFTRQVNEQKIPAGSEFAACPKCKQRFRFRTLETSSDVEIVSPVREDQPPSPIAEQPEAAKVAGNDPEPEDVWSAVEKLDANRKQRQSRADQAEDRTEHQSTEQEKNETRQPPDHFEERPEPEEDEDMRREALEAYRRQGASGEKPSLLANAGSVPWEYQGGFMTPHGFLRTLLLSFTRIPEFFGGIPSRGSLGPALVFALLLRCLQFTMVFLFIKVRVQDADGLIVEKNLAQLANVGALELIITSLFIIILVQFISAGLTNMMIWLVDNRKANFKLAFKMMAYSMTPLVFMVIPQIGFLIAEVGSLIFFILGLRHAFKLSWPRVALVLSAPLLVIVLLNMQLVSLLG